MDKYGIKYEISETRSSAKKKRLLTGDVAQQYLGTTNFTKDAPGAEQRKIPIVGQAVILDGVAATNNLAAQFRILSGQFADTKKSGFGSVAIKNI